MKKMEYKTPVLEVRAYAQFENVFTACTIAPGRSDSGGAPCVYNDNISGTGSGHLNLVGVGAGS